MTDTNFRVDAAQKLKASADDLREKILAGSGGATALELINKSDLMADEAIRAYHDGKLETGDQIFRASSEALEKASAALA